MRRLRAIGRPPVWGARGRKLLKWSVGRFTRSSTAVRVNGSPITLASIGANVLSLDDRGDGAGVMARIEGARTNVCADVTELDLWVQASGMVVTPNVAVGLLGAQTVDRLAFAADAISRLQQAQTLAAPVTLSIYARASGAPHLFTLGIRADATENDSAPITPGAAFARYSHTRAGYTTLNNVKVKNDTAVAGNIEAWLAQLESGRFPSSPIPTGGALRASDVLTFDYPLWKRRLAERAWRWTVSPAFANTDLVSGDAFTLLSFAAGGADQLRVIHTGAVVRIDAVAGGSVVASSGALTFARHALLAVVVNPAAGTVSVNGVAGAPGTPWSWPVAGTRIRIGGLVSGAGEAFCRFTEPRKAAG